MPAKELGDYDLLKLLGKGSLGQTWLAEHRFTKQQHAVKVLAEELAHDRSFVQRFQADIAKLAALQHPHLVHIHNVSYSDGVYFLVMDCIVDGMGESTNLADFLLSNPDPLEEQWLYCHLSQIASALDYIHGFEKGSVVHRALKPNNILIGGGADQSSWHLSDVGLTRIIGCGAVLLRSMKAVADALAEPALWAHAAAAEARYPFPPLALEKLTPLHKSFIQNYAFYAPEQKCIDGISSLDTSADVYAFGMLTYYLLTRRYPEGCFAMPSSLRGDLRWDWDTLVRWCLQQDPQQRPKQLVGALHAIKGRRDVTAGADEGERRGAAAVPLPGAAQALQRDLEAAPLAAPVSYCEEEAALRPGGWTTASAMAHDDLVFFGKSDGAVKQYHPENKEVKAVKPLLSETVLVEGGDFWRGSSEGCRDEMPVHQITLESFLIDVHPVTNEQFVLFLEFMGGEKDGYHRDIIRLKESRIKRSGGRLSIESGYAKHPVVGVTWYGAAAYAKWVGRRLPTEAEWEVAACGGGERLLFPTGDDIEKSEANFFSADTTAVKSYPPNKLGIYDMAGNVYEWCHDWYGYNYYEAALQEPDNPKGPIQGNYRVLRGGCWKSLKEDLRCAKRHRNKPGTVNSTYGFRCASNA